MSIVLNVAKALKDRHYYKEAETLVGELLKEPLEKELHQKALRLQAECIYQDRELPPQLRFDKALKVLENALLQEDFETLRLKGAIYKRRYQLYKKLDDLMRAIELYSVSIKDPKDDGYGAVNVIYLNLIRLHAEKNEESETRKALSSEINRQLRETQKLLEPKVDDPENKNVWIVPTLMEVYVVQKEYAKALKYADKLPENEDKALERFLNSGSRLLTPKLKKRVEKAMQVDFGTNRTAFTTAEQFINIYLLQNPDITDVSKMNPDFITLLEAMIPGKARDLIESVIVGKVGLALSGGGFRASLFHIGVLMRLAELDMLRHMEVISCVSGGSIVGMHYYIMLKKLLESKPNHEIAKEDYIELVHELKRQFVHGIQKNIRMMAFTCKGGSVIERLGQLYQQELYNQEYGTCTPTRMHELYIRPLTHRGKWENFKPAFNNNELKNKVPILVINATNLNTGHNWKFTASGMGESPYMYDLTVDKNPVYNYAPYREFSAPHNAMSIGAAVAASSCVPMLFSPLELEQPFQGIEKVRLVDGGVYDNQGLANLFDAQCSVIISSDASKQLLHESNPFSDRLSVSGRMNNILMQKSRDTEFRIAKQMLYNGQLKGLAVFHLKACAEAVHINPDGTTEVDDALTCKLPNLNQAIPDELRDKLANIRTDLDAFHDVEAQALMKSGYYTADQWFLEYADVQPHWKWWNPKASTEHHFAQYDALQNSRLKKVEELLENSRKVLFKTWPGKLFALGLLTLLLWLLCTYPVGVLIIIIVLVVGIVLVKTSKKMQWLLKVSDKLLDCVMMPIAKGYLNVFNELYLEKGKLGNGEK